MSAAKYPSWDNLHTFFEKRHACPMHMAESWKKATLWDVVPYAREYTERKLRTTRRMNWGLAAAAPFFMVTVGLIIWGWGENSKNPTGNALLYSKTLLGHNAFETGLIGFLGLVLTLFAVYVLRMLLVHNRWMEDSRAPESCKDFLDAVHTVCRATNWQINTNSEMNTSDVGLLCNQALSNAALKIREAEAAKGTSSDAEVQGYHEQAAGMFRRQLGKAHSAMKKLGLVPDGGYEPYFATADRLLQKRAASRAEV